jgi:AraC family transcriptional regulator
LYFENDRLKATLVKFQSILDGSGINDPAYAETLGLLLLWEIRHAADTLVPQLKPVRGGLTVLQLRRVKEFVDAKISDDIAISDLAAVAGLSQFHFIRAFKSSVGLSPYQYVPRSGLICKKPLSKRDLSIRRGAHGGFSDPSQLNRVFRKFLSYANGPGARYRRKLHLLVRGVHMIIENALVHV